MTAVTLTADGTTSVGGKAKAMVRDSVKTVIAASMVGTAIEFYDFYAYGTAAANYFPRIFFSAKDNPTVALLMSLLTFAIAFIARPLGSLIFGRADEPADLRHRVHRSSAGIPDLRPLR